MIYQESMDEPKTKLGALVKRIRKPGSCGRPEHGGVIIFLVGGLEHFLFFHLLGIIIPTDFHIFQRVWNHQPDFDLRTRVRPMIFLGEGFDIGPTWSNWSITLWPTQMNSVYELEKSLPEITSLHRSYTYIYICKYMYVYTCAAACIINHICSNQ